MQLVNRKTVTRVSALILVLMLILSGVSCFAASFKKSQAGVSYGGAQFKLGATTTGAKLKKAFGSCTTKNVAVCTTVPYGGRLYNFKSKGISIETRYKTEAQTSEQIITITLTGSTVPTISGLKVGNKVSKLAENYGTKIHKDRFNKNHAYYASGNYILDVYTRSKKISKLVFLIDL